jgi:hypothetical protein
LQRVLVSEHLAVLIAGLCLAVILLCGWLFGPSSIKAADDRATIILGPWVFHPTFKAVRIWLGAALLVGCLIFVPLALWHQAPPAKAARQSLLQPAEYPGDWIWEPNSQTLDRVPPIFLLRPSTLPASSGPFEMFGKNRCVARGKTVKELIGTVYSQKNSALKILFAADLPADKYDFIVAGQSGWPDKLAAEINQRFNLVEQIEAKADGDVVTVRSTSSAQAGTNAALNSEDDPTVLLAEQPPVVVETYPVSGATNVAPGDTEIRVRFSKPMTDGSWSWATAWEDSGPDFLERPHYNSNRRTCIVKVTLEPGKTYGWWLNSDRFKHFCDRAGQPAVPYLLIFHTKSATN